MAVARHLIIFVRHPRFGVGKSRLASGAGASTALRFQRVMLSLIAHRLSRDTRWRTWFAVTPDRSGPWPRHVGVLPQGKGDLGQRMKRVAKCMSPGPVVIVGTDIPFLRAHHIERAFEVLGRSDAAIGPTTDGGYWMIGLRRRPRFIDPFHGVRWSSEHAFGDTMTSLAGHKVAILDLLEDVDDVECLARSPKWAVLHARRSETM